MTVNVSPTAAQNTHHVKLSRGGDAVGLILCDARGNPDERALRSDPYPRSAIKFQSGESKHSDQELPYVSIVQEDWSRGRGQEVFEDDKTRYADSYKADTTRAGRIILPGEARYMTGYRSADGSPPGSFTFVALKDANRYLARKFTASASYGADKAHVWVRKVGAPGNLTLTLRADSGGSPGAVLQTAVLGNYTVTDVLSVFGLFQWFGSQALTSGTAYWIVVNQDVYEPPTSSDYWEAAVDVTTSAYGKKSSDGSAWSAASGGLHFRVTDADAPFTPIFGEYKGGLYMATRPDSGAAGKVYACGYRGLADDNTTDKPRLVDATQSWAIDELVGGVVELYDGAGSTEQQPWREIIGNYPTYATCSPPWEVVHVSNGQDATQYVIRGLDSWRLLQTGAHPFTDMIAAGEMLWLVSGEGKALTRPLYKLREYAAFSTWARSWGSEALIQGSFLRAQEHPTEGWTLWIGSNNDADEEVCVRRALAPSNWEEKLAISTPYRGTSTNGFMKEQTIANVTVTTTGVVSAKIEIGESFTTGLICSDRVGGQDWRRFTRLLMDIKSSKALSAGQLRLDIDDSALCGSPIRTIDFPALAKDINYSSRGLYVIAMEFDLVGVAGADAVMSAGLTLTGDAGEAFEINVGFHWLDPGLETITLGDKADKLTGLALYGDPPQLLALKQGSVYEVSNGIAKPLAITALGSMRSSDNGRAHVCHDVYLFFSMRRGMVERWYRGALDDVGPTRDEGLPAGRQGSFAAFADFPGGIFGALDGGTTGYSSIYFYNENGWHELYRAPRAGLRIRSLFVEPVQGREYVRVIFGQGADVCWFPFGLNPPADPDFRYAHEAALVSSRIANGKQDVVKLWKSIKLVSKGLSASVTVTAQYRVDGQAAWTTVGTFSQSPVQEIALPSQEITGRWLEYRLVLRTADAAVTPQVLAVVVEALEETSQKNMFTLTWRSDDDCMMLDGYPDPVSGRTKIAQIKTWQEDRKPITMNSIDEIFDAVLARPSSLSLRHVKTTALEAGRDVEICTLTLVEI